MEKFKNTNKKLLGTLFALLLVSSMLLGSSASASIKTKPMSVNGYNGTAQLVRNSRTASWTTAFTNSAVTSTVNGAYSYRSTSSGSLTSDIKIEGKTATAAVSVEEDLSSGLVFESLTGKHKATSGGKSTTVNTHNP